MKIAYSFFVLLMAITVAHAQHQSSLIGKTLDKHYYQKLEANSEEILHFSVDSIYVDTLILRDKSIIRFDVKSIFVTL